MKARRAVRRRHAPPPTAERQSLTAAQVLDARIVHNDLVHRLATGSATMGDVWDWMMTGFTYSQMMRLLDADGVQFTDEAMNALALQLETYGTVCARLRRTGRAGLTGPELQIAKEAAAVMDELIGMDRHGIAERAALWSTEQMARIRRTAR